MPLSQLGTHLNASNEAAVKFMQNPPEMTGMLGALAVSKQRGKKACDCYKPLYWQTDFLLQQLKLFPKL